MILVDILSLAAFGISIIAVFFENYQAAIFFLLMAIYLEVSAKLDALLEHRRHRNKTKCHTQKT